MNSSNLKSHLTRLVRNLRKNEYDYGDSVDVPQSTLEDVIVDGKGALKRRRVVLTAHGCCVSTCTMCPLPDESVPDDVEVTEQNLKNQIDGAFVNAEGLDVLTLYHNGNFFADKEISEDLRRYIYRKMAQSPYKYLIVETLPQFITREKLQSAKELMGDKIVQVAIGLQSWDDTVREYAINSTCTKKAFLKSIELLKEFGYIPQVFLMFKPAFLTVNESIVDLSKGVSELHKIGVDNPIICPMRISKHTLVDVLHQNNLYFPPTLWELLRAVEEIHTLTPNTNCRVAVSCITGVDGIQAIRAHSCKKCYPHIVNALNNYNQSHNLFDIQQVTCYCKPKIDVNFDISDPIIDRIEQVLSKL
jgi:radical SAM enzyme (TIGR01210 family)